MTTVAGVLRATEVGLTDAQSRLKPPDQPNLLGVTKQQGRTMADTSAFGSSNIPAQPQEENPAGAHSKPEGTFESMKETAREAAAAAADFADQAKDKVEELASAAVHQVKDKGEQMAATAAESAEAFAKDVTELIRRYPLPALAVGVAMGFLLGRAITRK